MNIKAHDGTIRKEPDDYVLRDGETLVVPRALMDSRTFIHDGRGNPAGQRPGFLFSDDDQAELEAARRQYAADISQRWQSGRWQSQPSKPVPAATGKTFDSPEAVLAAAHEQYRRDISERWRR
jgi:hypothetical protein